MKQKACIGGLAAVLAFAPTSHPYAQRAQTLLPAIVNGAVVADQMYPFMAAIQFSDAESLENPYAHQCGGTLISQNTVMTAAHCVSQKDTDGTLTIEPPSLFKVVLGMNSYGLGQGVTGQVKEIRVHPKYSRPKNPAFAYDVAILTLEEPITTIAPIQLGAIKPSKGLSTATVLGWGATSTSSPEMARRLQEGQVQTKTASQCAREVKAGTHGGLRFNSSIQLCTASASGPCNGDSGGPLLQSQSGRFVEVGIVSFGGNCGNGATAVYTRISNKDIIKFISANR